METLLLLLLLLLETDRLMKLIPGLMQVRLSWVPWSSAAPKASASSSRSNCASLTSDPRIARKSGTFPSRRPTNEASGGNSKWRPTPSTSPPTSTNKSNNSTPSKRAATSSPFSSIISERRQPEPPPPPPPLLLFLLFFFLFIPSSWSFVRLFTSYGFFSPSSAPILLFDLVVSDLLHIVHVITFSSLGRTNFSLFFHCM